MRTGISFLVVFFLGLLVGLPTIIRAGHTPGLRGRTHVIVKEHHLKQLIGEAQGVTPLVVDLFEVNRDGAVSTTPYDVPQGFVLVVTDVRIEARGQSVAIAGDLRAGANARWHFNTQAENHDNNNRLLFRQFKSGLVFDGGSPVNFFIPGPGGGDVKVEILGYETADV